MRTLLFLGGAGLLAWWYLSKQSSTSTSGTGTGTPPPSTPPATPPPGQVSQIASIYSALLTASQGQSLKYTRDQWNYFPNQVCGGCMPAPGDVWGPVETGSYDPNELIALSDYWNKMLPYLQSQGMSGLRGLGAFQIGWA